MENPRSYDPVGLAYRPFMAHLEDFRHSCTYCKYGARYKKPTNIWTNAPGVNLVQCSKNNPCKELRKATNQGVHPETAQAGPTGHQAGSGGGAKVYPIPPKLLQTLFKGLQFGRAAHSDRPVR